VKLAALRTNRALGFFPDPAKADAMERACQELLDGRLVPAVVVDALQGGAGTSTNMNVNEVLANRALELLDLPKGSYHRVSPLDDLNLHQSTNDTFPTALRVAAIQGLRDLERQVLALQEAFQAKEKAFAHVVKVGRTECQDAVLTTLGRSMGAYAEALNRAQAYFCLKPITPFRKIILGIFTPSRLRSGGSILPFIPNRRNSTAPLNHTPQLFSVSQTPIVFNLKFHFSIRSILSLRFSTLAHRKSAASLASVICISIASFVFTGSVTITLNTPSGSSNLVLGIASFLFSMASRNFLYARFTDSPLFFISFFN
jgi:hypothetical protein